MITYQMVLFFIIFFKFHIYAFVHGEFDNPSQKLAFEGELHLGDSYSLLNDGEQKETKCLRRAFPFSVPLRSSNDVRPKMSDQLAVLPLTFN